MPFQSEKQRRYLHANHPEIAKRWERDYANGGILDINASEEIISDDGNDIELTAYNAAFDDPNDLSTGVKSLFQAKDGGTPRRRYFTGAYGAGGTENRGSPSAGTAGSTGWGGPSPSSDRGPRDDPDRFGSVSKPQTVPAGINIHADTGDEEEPYEIVAGRKLHQSKWGVPGLDPREKAHTDEELLTAVYGTTAKGIDEKVAYRNNRTKVALELAERNQKAALSKWGLGKLGKLGVMLAAMVGLYKVSLGDALKALPKTISLSKKDLGTLVKESIPVMKAKKAHIASLTKSKQELLGQVDILNPNEMKSKIGTQISDITNEINDLTPTPPDDDTGGDGGPELPPQLGGPSTEEMSIEYVSPMWRDNQALYAQLSEKWRQEKADRDAQYKALAEENPIVSGTETDIIALGNSGGLANLFRVKNQ